MGERALISILEILAGEALAGAFSEGGGADGATASVFYPASGVSVLLPEVAFTALGKTVATTSWVFISAV